MTVDATYSYTRCAFGAATRDVSPPVGIYARTWGAATHEAAEGIQRPFAATAAVFAPLDGAGPGRCGLATTATSGIPSPSGSAVVTTPGRLPMTRCSVRGSRATTVTCVHEASA